MWFGIDMTTPIQTLDKRAWDGTGAGIGHGSNPGLIAKLNEVIGALNLLVGAGGTQADLIFAPLGMQLEIVSGVATVTQAVHSLAGEGSAADALTSLLGGSNYEIVLVRAADSASPITITHGVGADLIACPYGKNVVLTQTYDWALLLHDSTQWVVVAFSTVAANAGGAGAIIGLLGSLATTDKTSIVTAINELKALLNQAVLTTSTPTYADVILTNGQAVPNGTGVTSVSKAGHNKLVLTLQNTPVPLVDEAGVVAYGSLKVADLPEGVILHLGTVANLVLTKSSSGVVSDWDGDFGVGTVAASNNATLSTTEQDFIPTTPTPQAVAGASSAKGASTATEAVKIHDGHTTPKDIYLNLLVDDSDHDVTATPCNIIVNGTITFSYMNLGDY